MSETPAKLRERRTSLTARISARRDHIATAREDIAKLGAELKAVKAALTKAEPKPRPQAKRKAKS